MEYRIILPGGAWEEAGQQLADIYYTSAYYAMSTLVQGGEARCFHFVHRGMEAYYPFLQQAIPGTGLSDLQGAYGYNGVSCRKYDTDFQKAFHHQFSHYCEREGIVAEFTRFHPLSDNAAFSEGYLSVYRQRNTVGVDLSQGYEKVWNESYSTNNRNEIRRAAREGLCVEEAGSLAEYHAFAALYRQLMQERGAEDFFLWPDAYFSAAYALPPGERYLLLARSRDQVVGGALFLCHGNMAHYHLAA
ncbi:MAG TPA: GNAT family N-acetyltransferase, partial [Bacteroidales bacterium]|nr:GNAT family N-acetyltransferase [Bacteroidales bacterium]